MSELVRSAMGLPYDTSMPGASAPDLARCTRLGSIDNSHPGYCTSRVGWMLDHLDGARGGDDEELHWRSLGR